MSDSALHYCHSASEQFLYAHLQDCAEAESPQELLYRFRCLFIDAADYPDPEVWEALGRIVDADFANEEFLFILNRSCYILINRWRKQPRLQWAIPELIDLFDLPPTGLPHCWTAQRLRSLVKRFIQSQEFLALQRLAKTFAEKTRVTTTTEVKTLDTLIERYPYLYEHFFLTDDSTDDQRQLIRTMRVQAQQKFDQDLFQYLTIQKVKPEQRLIEIPTGNPTLLTEIKVQQAIQHFTGKVDGIHTYRELAQKFTAQTHQTRSYRTFKEDLYEYLSDTIDPKYGKNHFNNRLYKELQGTLSYNDSQKLNETLFAGTCRKLLNFLVIESQETPSHFVFMDLLGNMGITQSVGLLLKIVLVCCKVKADLEKRFALLFNHYATFPRDKVLWLVESLENVNIAFSTHFGTKKLCY